MATSISSTAITFSDSSTISHSTAPTGAKMKYAEVSTSTNRTLSTSYVTHLSSTVTLSKTQDLLIEVYFTTLYQTGTSVCSAQVRVGGTVIATQDIGTNQTSNKMQGSHCIIVDAQDITSGSKTIDVQVKATGGSNTILNQYGYSDYLKFMYI